MNHEEQTPIDHGAKTFTTHRKKIRRARQIVRGLMDELDHITDSRSDLETEIISMEANVSLAMRNARLEAISLPARAQMASDLANDLAVLIRLERQFYKLDI